MPVSVAVPILATHQGGFSTVDGDEWLLQLIMSSVSGNESDNPWNLIDIDPGEDMIFSINDASRAGVTEQNIRDLFDRLETQNFARLISITVQPSSTKPEELLAFIRYLNIESDSEVEVDVPLS